MMVLIVSPPPPAGYYRLTVTPLAAYFLQWRQKDLEEAKALQARWLKGGLSENDKFDLPIEARGNTKSEVEAIKEKITRAEQEVESVQKELLYEAKRYSYKLVIVTQELEFAIHAKRWTFIKATYEKDDVKKELRVSLAETTQEQAAQDLKKFYKFK